MRRLLLLGLSLSAGAGCLPASSESAFDAGACIPGVTSNTGVRGCPPGQVCGSAGCRPCETAGECEPGQVCCDGTCLTGRCTACSANGQCGDGRVCCEGVCTVGSCCTANDCEGRRCVEHECVSPAAAPARTARTCSRNESCLEGEACVGGTCGACSADGQCGPGGKCCAGRCSAGSCCDDSQCGPRGSCQNSSCQRCTSEVECEANERCCGGSCVPGDCCQTGECGGRTCRQNRCQACTDSAQCGAGQVCCEGLCSAGDCCSASDCGLGQVCHSSVCGPCQANADCGPAGACIEGTCVADAECGVNLDCSDGMCTVPHRKPPHPRALGAPCAQTSNCGFAEVCCGNVCVSGECCTTADCATLGYSPGTTCLQNACQPCSTNSQCGSGEVCCSGRCVAGACCPGSACAAGQVCNAYRCAACTSSTECGTGRVCCGGRCEVGDCCGGGDCGHYVCRGNHCSTCSADGDCPSGTRCCNGACTPAACCDNASCSGGKVCQAGSCVACARASDCGAGNMCCQGQCRSGNCCTSADCLAGTICNANGYCGQCTSTAQCGPGQRCCGGTCVSGTCCTDSECGVGKICTGNSCAACTSSEDCGRGQVCCNGGCRDGNCCSATVAVVPECNGLVCRGNVCTQCTSDSECGVGSKCCRGACYSGAKCCSSGDCAGNLACVNGACSSCSSDSECGSVSCCDADGAGPEPGRCQPFCSITRVYNTLATFNEGTLSGVTAEGSPLSPDCTVGTLCWSGKDILLHVPYIWVPSTGTGQVRKYNVETGAQEGLFNINVRGGWPNVNGTSPGTSPSRTSVNPFDSTVWVADRGFGGGRSGVAHLNYEGKMLCFANVPGIARALATDAQGNAWVGSYNNGTLTQFAASDLEPGSSNPRICKRLRTVGGLGSPYGAAGDNNNWIWVQGGRIYAVDANTGSRVRNYASPCNAYGITVDREYVWLGCYGSHGIGRITKSNGALAAVATGGNPRGIASGETFVYAASNQNFVVKMHRQTMEYSRIDVPGLSSIIAVAIDSHQRLWAVDYRGLLVRMEGDGTQQVTFGRTGLAQYTYTDLTGQQTINAGLAPGTWTVINDSGYYLAPAPRWWRLNLSVIKPMGTTISARVKVADVKSAFDTTPWWNNVLPPLVAPDGYREEVGGVIPLDDFALPRGRYLLIELRLTTSADTVTPVVKSLSAIWGP